MHFSLHTLSEDIRKVTLRFPLPLCYALLITVLGIILVHGDGDTENTILPLFISSILSFPFAVTAKLLLEKYETPHVPYTISLILLPLFTLGYYFLLPDTLNDIPSWWMFSWIMISGLGISTMITQLFLKKEEGKSQWKKAEKFTLRILIALLYSFSFGIGLSLALVACEQLFNLDIASERYGEIWTLAFGLLAPYVFLARLPNPREHITYTEFPKEFRWFGSFILIPLLTLYFVILYLYTGKILISWEWPNGFLSYLILAFSLLGLGTYLFLQPLEKPWVQRFEKIFFIALIPQVIMLWIAVGFRVHAYGITENRILLILGGVGLFASALYFLFSKKKALSTPFIIASILLFLALFGASPLARWSQTTRLLEMVKHAEMWENGTFIKNTGKGSDKEGTEMYGALSYLIDTHGIQSVLSYFPKNIQDEAQAKTYSWEKREVLMTYLGVTPYQAYNATYCSLSRNQEAPLFLGKNSYIFENLYVGSDASTRTFTHNNKDYLISLKENSTLVLQEKESKMELLSMDIQKSTQLLLEKECEKNKELTPTYKEYTFAPELFQVISKKDGYTLTFYPYNISANKEDGKGYVAHGYSGVLVVSME